MSNCTIFARVSDPKVLDDLLSSVVGFKYFRDGSKSEETRIVLNSSGGTVEFNAIQHREPGDMFSKTFLSIHNFFRVVQTTNEAEKKQVLDHLDATEMIIGVAAEPDFEADDVRLDVVFSVAESIDGLIFNGYGMIDVNGTLLLDRDGESEKASKP